MVGREVERLEHMPVILDLRPFGHIESQTAENSDYLLAHYRQRMTCAAAQRSLSARQVEGGTVRAGRFRTLAQSVDALGGEILEVIDSLTYRTLLVGGNIAEFIHQSRHSAFFAEVAYTQSLYFGSAGGFEGFYFGA